MDWREQTYPKWMKDNPVHIAMSKSLSTNLNHLFLLRSLEELTGEEHNSSEKMAIILIIIFGKEHIIHPIKTTELNPAAVENQDMLGTALAVLDLKTHPEAIQQYPHGQFGPPVIYPQQQHTPFITIERYGHLSLPTASWPHEKPTINAFLSTISMH